MSVVQVRDIVGAVDREMPFAWAESWDRVGLLAGDPAGAVEKVFVTLDPTPRAFEAARCRGQSRLIVNPSRHGEASQAAR